MTRCARSLLTISIALLALAACDTVGIKRSYMALDAKGYRQRNAFQTDTESIYCVAEMASGVDDVTVVAKVRARSLFDPFNGRRVTVDGSAVVGAEEQAPGRGEDLILAFHLLKPEGDEFYPAGEFSCDLYVDGKREESLDFVVRYPDCPFEPIKAESSCAGVVLYGSECPSPLGARCVCSEESEQWECE
ncbi:MAG TPA: hypothetical protein VMF89_29995 [Polyangiales bacterium]|nr:hypothetical protein [Polyangiales bacterium]